MGALGSLGNIYQAGKKSKNIIPSIAENKDEGLAVCRLLGWQEVGAEDILRDRIAQEIDPDRR